MAIIRDSMFDALDMLKLKNALFSRLGKSTRILPGTGGYSAGPTAGPLGRMSMKSQSGGGSSNFDKLLSALYGNKKKKKLIGVTNQGPGGESGGGITLPDGTKRTVPGLVPPGLKRDDWDLYRNM
jgi:hypothetical protein